MTAQFSELLKYRGEELSLFTEPLDGYLKSAGLHAEVRQSVHGLLARLPRHLVDQGRPPISRGTRGVDQT